MLSPERIEEIMILHRNWEKTNEDEYPCGDIIDEFIVTTAYNQNKELVDLALREMNVSLVEFREYLEQTAQQIKEYLLIESDMSEEELREAESLAQKDFQNG